MFILDNDIITFWFEIAISVEWSANAELFLAFRLLVAGFSYTETGLQDWLLFSRREQSFRRIFHFHYLPLKFSSWSAIAPRDAFISVSILSEERMQDVSGFIAKLGLRRPVYRSSCR